MALLFAAAQHVDAAVLVDEALVAGVQPPGSVAVGPQGGGVAGHVLAVAQHHAGAGDAQLADLAVIQLLLRAGPEHAHVVQGHGDAHAAVPGGDVKDGHDAAGAGLALSIGEGVGCEIVVLGQKGLDILQLHVVDGLAARAGGQQMGQVVVLGQAPAAHQGLDEHGDMGPEVGPVAHDLQVQVLHLYKGVENQNPVGGHGHEQHGDDHGHQAGRQDGHQPGGAEGHAAGVEAVLMGDADDGARRVDDLLGGAGGAAGVDPQQRPVVILGSLLALEAITHGDKGVPVHQAVIPDRLGGIAPLNDALHIVGHGLGLGQAVGRDGDEPLNTGGGVSVQLLLGQEVVNDHHMAAGPGDGLGILRHRVVTAQDGRAHLFGGQQQDDELRHGPEQHGELGVLPHAHGPQGPGGLVHHGEELVPGNVRPIVVDGGVVSLV